MTVLGQYYLPFAFDNDKEDTEFEIIMNIDGFEYKYGFSYNDKRIVNEWMYRKNNSTNRNSVIYERDDEGRIQFGSSVRKECAQYGGQIPHETLLLSFFNKLKLKTPVFNKVYRSILDTFAMDTDFFENLSVLDKTLPEIIDTDKANLLKFLTAIDSGIKDIVYESRDNEKYFFTIHEDVKGNNYSLLLFHESEGTIKSIIIYIFAKIAVQSNKSLFVDELNALSDYKVRSDASFEKDYLAGVYGGIPLLREFSLKEGE